MSEAVTNPLIPEQQVPELIMPAATELSPDVVLPADAPEVTRMTRMREWASKHKGWLVGGAFVASTGLSLTVDPATHTVHELEKVAPWIGAGMITSEAAWIAGAAVCAASVGDKVPLNPLKLKSRFGEIAQKANESKTFKAGFWLIPLVQWPNLLYRRQR